MVKHFLNQPLLDREVILEEQEQVGIVNVSVQLCEEMPVFSLTLHQLLVAVKQLVQAALADLCEWEMWEEIVTNQETE